MVAGTPSWVVSPRHILDLRCAASQRLSLFLALGFARQNSDGNVSAKLNKPSTNTAANAAISVMGRNTVAPVSDKPMTQTY